MATRVRTTFRCTHCDNTVPKWAGRCSGCGEWGSLVEARESPHAARTAVEVSPLERAVPIAEVDAHEWAALPTGVDELDRVLGGGLVPGSVTLVGGEPGIGKSTLLLQALASLAGRGRRCLLVCGEESRQQVRLRAERLGAVPPDLWVVAETSLPYVLAHVEAVKPDVCVVDSIQTVHEPEVASAPGSVAQVRECAQRLVQVAKERAMATVVVGHVTKDGALAGPRALEHIVDTVLSFEGDRHHGLRLLRALKHRFGPTSELGLFDMRGEGLVGVPDAGALFLSDRREGVAGSVVVATAEGRRPLLVEVQALTVKTGSPMPRRSAQGVDGGRLALLLAVLHQRAGVALDDHDVYVSAVGGSRVAEPGGDLAVALAVASARRGVPVDDGVVAFGEVGLAGEIRQVAHTARRLAEAARLGFRTAIVPPSAPAPPPGLEAVRATTLRQAMQAAGLVASVPD